MRKILFSINRVEAAARFIFMNNAVLVRVQKVTSWQDVRKMILDDIRSVAEGSAEVPSWTSTGGWILVFNSIDYTNVIADVHECDVFVNPSVSDAGSYVTNDVIIGGE